jgi:hypothetical protein
MIASPYAIPSSNLPLEATGTPYYVPTASPKTESAGDSHSASSKHVMSITRETPHKVETLPVPVKKKEWPETQYGAWDSETTQSSHDNTSATTSVIYVPTTTSTPVKPFGVPLDPVKPVTPTFSVGMKNDKRK